MTENENLKKLHGAVAKMLGDFDKRLTGVTGKPQEPTKPNEQAASCFFCEGTGCFVCK